DRTPYKFVAVDTGAYSAQHRSDPRDRIAAQGYGIRGDLRVGGIFIEQHIDARRELPTRSRAHQRQSDVQQRRGLEARQPAAVGRCHLGGELGGFAPVRAAKQSLRDPLTGAVAVEVYARSEAMYGALLVNRATAGGIE